MNISKTLVVAIAAPVLAMVLVACGTDDESGNDSAGGDDTGSATSGGVLSTQSIDGAGEVYVNADDRAVYVAEEEKSGEVVCTGACLEVWKPVVAGDSSATGDFGTLTRPDTDVTQLTYQGAPVYTFTLEGPDEVTGEVTDEFNGTSLTWHVVRGGGAAPSDDEPTSDPGGGYGY